MTEKHFFSIKSENTYSYPKKQTKKKDSKVFMYWVYTILLMHTESSRNRQKMYIISI